MSYTVGEIVSIKKGKKHSLSEEVSNESSRYIQIEDLRNNLNFKYTDDDFGVDAMPEDVLIAWDGANAGTIGYNLKGKLGSTLARLRINKNAKVNSVFLGMLLQSKFNYLRRTATGATIPHINRKALEKIKIPKIDILSQKRIAQVLSDCEALISKRKESIALLDELEKSIFLEMFGDPRTNEMGWEFDQVSKYANCIVPGRDKPKSFTGNIPWVTTNDLNHLGFTSISKGGIGLNEEEINHVRARTIPKGSVLMTCVGDLGVVSIAKKRMLVNQQLHSFQVLEGMNNIFLMFALSFQKSIMYKLASTTTVPYLNKTNCNSIPVIRPEIKLQEKFKSIYSLVEGIKKLKQCHLRELENLYSRLSQDAFKGDLDLSGVVLREEFKKKDFNGLSFSYETNITEKETETVEVNQNNPDTDNEQFEISLGDFEQWNISDKDLDIAFENLSLEHISKIIKERFKTNHFSVEMLNNFLKTEKKIDLSYYSSEDLKKKPHLNNKLDLKKFLFSSIRNMSTVDRNPYLTLEQHFYNGHEENFDLKLHTIDYQLFKSKDVYQRSGIYFSIKE